MSEFLVATVVSKSSPIVLHMYRSSKNFSISSRAKYIRFKVVNHSDASSIRFDVKKDVRWWESWNPFNDEVIYSDVCTETTKKVQVACEMYIATPRGADGKNFTVQVYEVYEALK